MAKPMELTSLTLITLKNWNASQYLLSVVENQWPRVQFAVAATRDDEGAQLYHLTARGRIDQATITQLVWFARGVAAAIGAPAA